MLQHARNVPWTGLGHTLQQKNPAYPHAPAPTSAQATRELCVLNPAARRMYRKRKRELEDAAGDFEVEKVQFDTNRQQWRVW